MLIARSYAESHYQDNPHGAISCTMQDLAEELSDSHDRSEMWQALIDAKLVTVKGGDWKTDAEADVEILLNDFNEWQHPKGSAARRKAEQRISEKSRVLQGSVTTCHGLSQSVTQTETETETETEIEKEIKKEELLSESTPTHDDIQTVFEHWVTTTWTGKGVRPKLSPKRRQRIKSRLKDWSVQQLQDAISGYAADPFYSGEKDGKPKLELVNRLASTEEVERGLSLRSTLRPVSSSYTPFEGYE